MRTRLLMVLLALLSVWACESDVDKLARLETDLSIARLGTLGPQRKVDAIADSLGGIPSVRDTTASARAFWAQMDSVNAAERRVTLARRELDRFLGR